MEHDDLFGEKRNRVDDFTFGAETTAVFDDMVSRSVPFYAEIQRMVTEQVADFATPGSNVYDLGCSTCTTFAMCRDILPNGVRCIGIDSSPEMLEKGRSKLMQCNFNHPLELVRQDLNQGVVVENASVVIMNLTLQFIRPLYRSKLIESIASGVNQNGCLLLVEKILSPDSTINRLFIKYYYDYKRRNGYSELEIAQKREALENVLVPYRYEENRELLLNHGFSSCDMFFRWYNFCGILALKQ